MNVRKTEAIPKGTAFLYSILELVLSKSGFVIPNFDDTERNYAMWAILRESRTVIFHQLGRFILE